MQKFWLIMLFSNSQDNGPITVQECPYNAQGSPYNAQGIGIHAILRACCSVALYLESSPPV